MLEPLIAELRGIADWACNVGEMKRDAEAREAWHRIYGDPADVGDGLTGAVLGRAEAHVLRLSLIYAVLDRSATIRCDHLLAALALWDYCVQSARHFRRLGMPLADQIRAALRSRGELGRGCP